VDRNHRRYGTPYLPASPQRENRNRKLLSQPPVYLKTRHRVVVEASIRETCSIRKRQLWELNVRTNHVHIVLSCQCKPGLALSALKANATRSMRKAGCWKNDLTPWVQGGSKKYLWSEKELGDAIAYVKYDQGLPLNG
jgi:REP element-mobilizing transposase RayT